MLHRWIPFLVLVSASVSQAPDAVACSRIGGPPILQESFRASDEVFIAHLVSAAEIQFPGDDGDDEEDRFDRIGIEGRYTLIESLKGSPAKQGIVHDFPFGPGNCSLGLLPGWDYVFFVETKPEHPGIRWVGMFSGSFPLGPYRSSGTAEEKELVELRALIKREADGSE